LNIVNNQKGSVTGGVLYGAVKRGRRLWHREVLSHEGFCRTAVNKAVYDLGVMSELVLVGHLLLLQYGPRSYAVLYVITKV